MTEPSRAEMRAKLHRIQGGRCAVCRKATDLVMDHDHQTGLARGLLCQPCNLREGKDHRRRHADIEAYLADPPAASFRWLWKLPDWWNVHDSTRARKAGLTVAEYIEVFNAQRRAEFKAIQEAASERRTQEAIEALGSIPLPELA